MCQQIQQQAVNNPQDFQLSEGVPNPVVPVTANGVVPIDSLLAQTPNDVHPRSTFATGSVQETDALARRRAQGAPYRESRGGLASDEVGLGGGRWWSGTQELKQKIMDVANAPGLWPVSAVGKLLTMPLGGFGKQDKAIRRIRHTGRLYADPISCHARCFYICYGKFCSRFNVCLARSSHSIFLMGKRNGNF